MNKDELQIFGKKKKSISSEELRKKLIGTASEIIFDHGLTVSLKNLEMEALIKIADVPRSSVYKLWKSKDRFIVDLVVALIEPTSEQGAAFDPQTLEVSQRVIEKHSDLLGTPEGRDAVIREAIRHGAKRNFEALLESPAWRTYTVISTALPDMEAKDAAKVRDALVRAETHFISRMASFYDQALPLLGIRPIPGISTEQIAAAGAAVVEGLSRRFETNAGVVSKPIILPGIDGSPVEWHLAALGFLGVIQSMTEHASD